MVFSVNFPVGGNAAKHTVVTLWATTVRLHLDPLLSEEAVKPLVQREAALQVTTDNQIDPLETPRPTP